MCHLALMPAAVGRYSVVRLLRTQLRRAPYFTYGGVGSSPTVRSELATLVLLAAPALFMPLFTGVLGETVWKIAEGVSTVLLWWQETTEIDSFDPFWALS